MAPRALLASFADSIALTDPSAPLNAGVPPLVGLYAAFIVGLITAVFGGRPGMISGATGALAVVIVSLVSLHGVEYLFATVVLMGLIQIVVGVMRWGKFIRLVPHPVMLGFVNGLAIVIFLAQLGQFKVPGTAEAAGHGMSGGTWLSGLPLIWMLGLTALTMFIIWGAPKVTNLIPAPLAGIGIVAAIVIVFGIDVPVVGDLASIEGTLPPFHIPMVPFTWETFLIILPFSLILRLFRRHGGLRHDRSVDDQREIGRSYADCRDRGRAVSTGLHPVRLWIDSADPAGRAGWRHVHGRDRHLRVEQL